MLVPLVKSCITAWYKVVEELRMCTVCGIFFNNAYLAWKAITFPRHLYIHLHFVKGSFLNTRASRGGVTLWINGSSPSQRASWFSRGSVRGRQRELVLLTVRRPLAGTPGGIELGQQLASCGQNQVLTGCSPIHNYQYSVPGMSSFPSFSLPTLVFTLSFPVVFFTRVTLGLPSLRRGQSRRITALPCRTLGFSGSRRHCARRGFWWDGVVTIMVQCAILCIAASRTLPHWWLWGPGLPWTSPLVNQASCPWGCEGGGFVPLSPCV